MYQKPPFGPVLKIEPSALAHNYGKALIGIEYFIMPKISLSHEIGTVITIENYNFNDAAYDDFWGIAFSSDIRYYFHHRAYTKRKYMEDLINPIFPAFYLSLDPEYSYTEIDSYYVAKEGESFEGGFSYLRRYDSEISRQWIGAALKFGTQINFENIFTIDANAGIGVRHLQLTYSEAPADKAIESKGIPDPNYKVAPYVSISLLLGYDLSRQRVH